MVCLKVHKEGQRDTEAKYPNCAKSIMLGAWLTMSGKRRHLDNRRWQKNDQTLFLLHKAPMSGDRTKRKGLLDLLGGKRHLPSRPPDTSNPKDFLAFDGVQKRKLRKKGSKNTASPTSRE